MSATHTKGPWTHMPMQDTIWANDGDTKIATIADLPWIESGTGRRHSDFDTEQEQAEHGYSTDEDEAAGFEPGTLENDRRMARRGISVARFSSGAVITQNSRGRCEDAPCCGCCS